MRYIIPPRTTGLLPTRAELQQLYYTAGILEQHEAGHVVVAHALGLRVDQAVADGTDGGESFAGIMFDGDDHKAMLVYLAGTRAERTHPAWHEGLDAAFWGDSGDAREFMTRLRALPLSLEEADHQIEQMTEQVDQILQRHAEVLDHVQQALWDQGTLGWRRLDRLLAPIDIDADAVRCTA